MSEVSDKKRRDKGADCEQSEQLSHGVQSESITEILFSFAKT